MATMRASEWTVEGIGSGLESIKVRVEDDGDGPTVKLQQVDDEVWIGVADAGALIDALRAASTDE